MPVVLQHAGHSRTVVGYEVQGNGKCNLLVFDPSKCVRSVPSSHNCSRSTTRSLHAAVPELQGGLGMSSHASRDRRLVTRIKDTMLYPITGMRARKRKASPGVIDLTRPTQKRSRSASGNDIIIIDEDTQSMAVGECKPGRSPSVELQGERSLARSDVMGRVLNWSRLSMKKMRSAPVKPPPESQLICFCRKKDKYQILHFPLTAPLTDAEKSQRKIVTSLKL